MARILRKPPKPPFYNANPGFCRGCGVEFKTKSGKPSKSRRWCPECALDWRVAAQPDVARAAVFMRDQGICHDCGLDCTSYEVDSGPAWGTYQVQINRQRALEWCERMLNKTRHPRQTLYIIDLGQWHVDHAMPLHLIDRNKPDAWREWTLPNLRTRCPSCHSEKTAQEAKDRGKVRRLNGTTKKKPGRKIAQRVNPWAAPSRWVTKKELEEEYPSSEDEAPPFSHADKPWIDEPKTASWRGREIMAAVQDLSAEMDRRDKIQAAHKNPPPRKLKPRGFGK